VIDPTARIHATADLAGDVDVGPGTAIGPRTSLGAGARIGRDGDVGGDVFIDAGVVVGDSVRIQHAAILYRGVTVAAGCIGGCDPDQRPPPGRSTPTATWPARRTSKWGSSMSRPAPRSAPGRSSSRAATSGATRWSAPGRS
jgi:acyl-[acyl carrier protein]--UDP-N-acetylglucosamine O-acyltransferase